MWIILLPNYHTHVRFVPKWGKTDIFIAWFLILVFEQKLWSLKYKKGERGHFFRILNKNHLYYPTMIILYYKETAFNDCGKVQPQTKSKYDLMISQHILNIYHSSNHFHSVLALYLSQDHCPTSTLQLLFNLS